MVWSGASYYIRVFAVRYHQEFLRQTSDFVRVAAGEREEKEEDKDEEKEEEYVKVK